MNYSPKFLIKILEQHGYYYKRAKGAHQLFYNTANNKTIIVPFHGGKDLKKGTFLTIIKQAGIDKSDLT